MPAQTLPDAAHTTPRAEVVVVTTFFPNATDPHRTVFIKNLVLALGGLCAVRVIAPVPFAPAMPWVPRWNRLSRIPRSERIDSIGVEHPRFAVLPKVPLFTGLAYAVSLLPLFRRLRRETPHAIVHAHCAFPDAVGVALAARVVGLPYVVTAHGSDVNVYARRLSLRWQIRWALAHARAVIAVSGALADQLRRLLGDARRPGIAQIPCAGFRPALFAIRDRASLLRRLGMPEDSRVALFVGNLVPIKGVDHLLEAWHRLRACGALGATDRLVIIGDGPERERLERSAASKGIERDVSWLGAVAQSVVADWVGAAWLLCLPSLNEGMPNVAIEALASGTPVVASRVGGIPELVVDGLNGTLVPPAQPEPLADALEHTLRRTWDREPIAASVQGHTWDALARRNWEVLRASRAESTGPAGVAGEA